jgi:hypothetical protein
VRYHGYSEPLTVKQCGDLEDENGELERRIMEIENRQSITLEQILEEEKAKYEELKLQLVEQSDPVAASKAHEAKIKELKAMIGELSDKRKNKVAVHYPGIERLKNENEELRQSTIANLKVHKL